MNIRILYLFHDLMNLYGDYGNVVILKSRLEDQGAEVTVESRSVGDTLFDGDYDFIYCGSGTEAKRDVALKALRAEKDALKKALEKGTPVLFTGNSWEMLGKSILTVKGEKLEGLGFFGFEVVEDPAKRITHDIVAKCSVLDKPVVGFINKCSSITSAASPLFDKIVLGPGNSAADKTEGLHSGSFYGTGLIGPLLVKNPHMLNMFLKGLLGDSFREIEYGSAEKAYEVTLKALLERV